MIQPLGALTAGLLALTLAGCATDAGPGASMRTPAAAGIAQPSEGAQAVVPVAAVGLAPRTLGPNGDPVGLRDLDADAVTRLIGPPHYIRHDGNAVVWQYQAPGCVVDLFWYSTVNRTSRVLDYQIRSTRLAATPENRTCFGNLLTRRAHAVDS